MNLGNVFWVGVTIIVAVTLTLVDSPITIRVSVGITYLVVVFVLLRLLLKNTTPDISITSDGIKQSAGTTIRAFSIFKLPLGIKLRVSEAKTGKVVFNESDSFEEYSFDIGWRPLRVNWLWKERGYNFCRVGASGHFVFFNHDKRLPIDTEYIVSIQLRLWGIVPIKGIRFAVKVNGDDLVICDEWP